MQRALEEERVEVDPVTRERALNLRQQALDRGVSQLVDGGVGRTWDRVREFDDVVPLVSTGGHLLAARTRPDRGTEELNLAAGVVEVVLARHSVTVVLEDACERVPIRGVTPAGGDQRPRRVSGDELDQNPLRALGLPGAKPLSRRGHGRQGLPVPLV